MSNSIDFSAAFGIASISEFDPSRGCGKFGGRRQQPVQLEVNIFKNKVSRMLRLGDFRYCGRIFVEGKYAALITEIDAFGYGYVIMADSFRTTYTILRIRKSYRGSITVLDRCRFLPVEDVAEWAMINAIYDRFDDEDWKIIMSPRPTRTVRIPVPSRPHPVSTSSDSGMSTAAKVAIGVGIAVAAGIVIAAALSDSKEDM